MVTRYVKVHTKDNNKVWLINETISVPEVGCKKTVDRKGAP